MFNRTNSFAKTSAFIKIYLSFFIGFSCVTTTLFAQENVVVPLQDTLAKTQVATINIIGNKRTKNYIILREMPFKEGSFLLRKDIANILLQARNQVYNTNLFSEVTIDTAKINDSALSVNIILLERWYIYPTPQFQLADRSFNEWIKTYNADLNRVIYGVKFAYFNFSGRRDVLRFSLLNGYARNFSASYNSPYSNLKLTEGFGVAASFTQNREIPYATSVNNRILFFRKTGFIRSSANASTLYSIRKGFFKNTGFGLGVSAVNVNDSVLTTKFNPNYFNSTKSSQVILDLSFGVSYANTNNINYPQKGLVYNYGISHRGLGFKGGLNGTTISGSFAKYYPHKNGFFSTVQSSAIVKVPFEQAYINRRAIGYGSLNLRGLEVYVVDGVAAAVAKYTLTKKVVGFKLPLPFKIKTVPYIPFQIFVKGFTDVGYSYNHQQAYDTKLNNKMLYTGGFGIDILTLYDIVFKFEYSFNQLGEKGLFLHGNDRL